MNDTYDDTVNIANLSICSEGAILNRKFDFLSRIIYAIVFARDNGKNG